VGKGKMWQILGLKVQATVNTCGAGDDHVCTQQRPTLKELECKHFLARTKSAFEAGVGLDSDTMIW
jgi:hypothetical protein